MNGKGLIANKNKEVLYEGGFVDNNFNGFGVLYNPSKQETEEEISFVNNLDSIGNCWDRYEGLFKNN